jgi:cell division septal protein FtsQ
MSYRKRHVKTSLNRAKYQKSAEKPIYKKLWFWILCLGFIGFFLISYFCIFYSGVQIENITISGNQRVSTQDLDNFINENINIKIISLGNIQVNSKSIFLISSSKLSRKISESFPAIENVKINKKFMHGLDFSIIEKSVAAVFCADNNSQECYFIDRNGIMFEKISSISENTIIITQSVNEEKVSLGEVAVSKNIMETILKIEKNINDKFQLRLSKAYLASPIKLEIITSENWKVYFSLDNDYSVDTQLDNFDSLLTNGLSEWERSNLRYVNLIPKGKAIICDNQICVQ